MCIDGKKKICINGLYDCVSLFMHEHLKNVIKLFLSTIFIPPEKLSDVITDILDIFTYI